MSGRFSRGVKAWAAAAILEVDQTKKAAAMEFMGGTISDTPVLEGRLRGNWRFSKGSALTSVSSARDKGNATRQQVEAAILASKVEDVLILRNNLPYAYRIEYQGWSKQKAPQGMVRRNFYRVRQNILKYRTRRGS